MTKTQQGIVRDQARSQQRDNLLSIFCGIWVEQAGGGTWWQLRRGKQCSCHQRASSLAVNLSGSPPAAVSHGPTRTFSGDFPIEGCRGEFRRNVQSNISRHLCSHVRPLRRSSGKMSAIHTCHETCGWRRRTKRRCGSDLGLLSSSSSQFCWRVRKSGQLCSVNSALIDWRGC